MKKIKALIVVFVLMFSTFSACKKDDDINDQSRTDVSLIGKWVLSASYLDDGRIKRWQKPGDGEGRPLPTLEFTSEGKFVNSTDPKFIAYKIASPGALLIEMQDGYGQPFKYFGTESGELVLSPNGGKYACYDNDGCFLRYKRLQ